MGVIPAVILWAAGGGGFDASSGLPIILFRFLTGMVLIGLGAYMTVRSVSLFTDFGDGTPAPWAPPKKLVIRDIYRHARNPMIGGVFCVLLGEALWFGSWGIGAWFLFFLTANLIYIPLFEEPELRRRFGEPYDLYRENVPRWLPRKTAWKDLENRE